MPCVIWLNCAPEFHALPSFLIFVRRAAHFTGLCNECFANSDGLPNGFSQCRYLVKVVQFFRQKGAQKSISILSLGIRDVQRLVVWSVMPLSISSKSRRLAVARHWGSAMHDGFSVMLLSRRIDAVLCRSKRSQSRLIKDIKNSFIEWLSFGSTILLVFHHRLLGLYGVGLPAGMPGLMLTFVDVFNSNNPVRQMAIQCVRIICWRSGRLDVLV